MIKKLLIIFTILMGVSLLFGVGGEVAQAQTSQLFSECNDTQVAAQSPELCDVASSANSAEDAGLFGTDSLLSRVTRVIIFVTGGVSVLMIVIGGLRYVLSNGDPQGISSAKNTILYAIIGLVIALLAEAILRLVLQRL